MSTSGAPHPERMSRVPGSVASLVVEPAVR
jgi:hypothetical protein